MKPQICKLSANFWREGRHMVAVCPELGVSSFGRNLDHARRRLEEAVELYLDNARETRQPHC